MTAELVEFLLACIADDEQQAGSETVWLVHHGVDPLPHGRFSCGEFWPYVEVFSRWADAFKRLGELRDMGVPTMFEEVPLAAGGCVLAECESKRRLIELSQDATGLDMDVDSDRLVGERTWPYIGDVMLQVMALPFSGRPGYRQEWTP